MKTITAQKNLILQIIMIISLALTFALTAKAGKQERQVKNFHRIEISSAFEVILTQGTAESLTIEADDKNLPDIITEVKGGTLIIRTENNTKIRGTLKAHLTFVNLDEISVSGAVKLSGNGPLKFTDLEMDGSGASEVDLDLSASRVDADFSGASKSTFRGTARELDMELSGASNLDASEFKTQDCKLSCSGASKASVYASGTLSVEGSGATQISYAGNPSVDSDMSGASCLRKL